MKLMSPITMVTTIFFFIFISNSTTATMTTKSFLLATNFLYGLSLKTKQNLKKTNPNSKKLNHTTELWDSIISTTKKTTIRKNSTSFIISVSNEAKKEKSKKYFSEIGIIKLYIITFLCLFGILGNVMSIIVLLGDRNRKKSLFLLQVLAVVDFSYVFFSLLRSPWMAFIRKFFPNHVYFSFKFQLIILPCLLVVQTLGIWITVLVSVDRMTWVRYPRAAIYKFNQSKRKKYVIILLFASLLLHSPRFFDQQVNHIDNSFLFSLSTFSFPNQSFNTSLSSFSFTTSAFLMKPIKNKQNKLKDKKQFLIYPNNIYTKQQTPTTPQASSKNKIYYFSYKSQFNYHLYTDLYISGNYFLFLYLLPFSIITCINAYLIKTIRHSYIHRNNYSINSNNSCNCCLHSNKNNNQCCCQKLNFTDFQKAEINPSIKKNEKKLPYIWKAKQTSEINKNNSSSNVQVENNQGKPEIVQEETSSSSCKSGHGTLSSPLYQNFRRSPHKQQPTFFSLDNKHNKSRNKSDKSIHNCKLIYSSRFQKNDHCCCFKNKENQKQPHHSSSFKSSLLIQNTPTISSLELNASLVLVYIIIIFFICESPEFSIRLLAILDKYLIERKLLSENHFQIFCLVSECFMILKSSLNFFVYLAFDRRFRKILSKICQLPSNQPPKGMNQLSPPPHHL